MQGAARALSTAALPLMRDYIHAALYSSAAPYFSKPVIAPTPPAAALHFSALLGQAEYDARVAALYAASARGWLTPVELFAPWYSYGIARCVLGGAAGRAAASGAAALRVYEVGGGTGAHARHFLDYVRAAAPALYARPGGVSYTILEISPQLCERQNAALEAAGHGQGLARSQCLDATRAHEHLHDARPCTVVALEVLDNLPHDKVVCLGGALHEACVEERGSSSGAAVERAERYRPLADPLLLEAWQWMEAYGTLQGRRQQLLLPTGPLAALCRALPRSAAAAAAAPAPPLPPGFQWAMHAPTGALALLKALRAALPAHSLLLADFSHLPHPKLRAAAAAGGGEDCPVTCHAPADAPPGCGGPPWAALHLRGLTERPGGRLLASGPAHRLTSAPLLVASKGGRCGSGERDHATYLSPPLGEADIFFPTDFGLLAHMVAGLGGGGSSGGGGSAVAVEPSRDFLTRHAQWERTRTLTGFNPMLDTYANTRFLSSAWQG
jgi:hypothetical protein